MNFQEITEAEFEKFEQANRYGNLMQTAERAKLRERMGFKSYLVGVKNSDNVVGVGLIVERYGEAWIQMGPILDWKNIKAVDFFVKEVLDFCKKKKFSELEVFPPLLLSIRDGQGVIKETFEQKAIFEVFSKYGFSHMGMTTAVEYKAMRWTYIKRIEGFKNLAEVASTFKHGTRNALKRVKDNVEVSMVKEKKDLKEWIKPLRSSDERNGVHTRDLKYFEDVWDVFGDKALFIEARNKGDGKNIASVLSFVHPNEMVSLLSGELMEGRKLNGPTAIKGWQFEECLTRGINKLNFYGFDADFSAENSLLNFKRGFGGEVEEYIGGFKKVLNPYRYYGGKVSRKIKRIFK